jgi:GAF domain-containing protein
VIPLFKEGINIGQLDVDSHTLNPFSKKDEYLLEWVNEKVALIL